MASYDPHEFHYCDVCNDSFNYVEELLDHCRLKGHLPNVENNDTDAEADDEASLYSVIPDWQKQEELRQAKRQISSETLHADPGWAFHGAQGQDSTLPIRPPPNLIEQQQGQTPSPKLNQFASFVSLGNLFSNKSTSSFTSWTGTSESETQSTSKLVKPAKRPQIQIVFPELPPTMEEKIAIRDQTIKNHIQIMEATEYIEFIERQDKMVAITKRKIRKDLDHLRKKEFREQVEKDKKEAKAKLKMEKLSASQNLAGSVAHDSQTDIDLAMARSPNRHIDIEQQLVEALSQRDRDVERLGKLVRELRKEINKHVGEKERLARRVGLEGSRVDTVLDKSEQYLEANLALQKQLHQAQLNLESANEKNRILQQAMVKLNENFAAAEGRANAAINYTNALNAVIETPHKIKDQPAVSTPHGHPQNKHLFTPSTTHGRQEKAMLAQPSGKGSDTPLQPIPSSMHLQPVLRPSPAHSVQPYDSPHSAKRSTPVQPTQRFTPGHSGERSLAPLHPVAYGPGPSQTAPRRVSPLSQVQRAESVYSNHSDHSSSSRYSSTTEELEDIERIFEAPKETVAASAKKGKGKEPAMHVSTSSHSSNENTSAVPKYKLPELRASDGEVDSRAVESDSSETTPTRAKPGRKIMDAMRPSFDETDGRVVKTARSFSGSITYEGINKFRENNGSNASLTDTSVLSGGSIYEGMNKFSHDNSSYHTLTDVSVPPLRMTPRPAIPVALGSTLRGAGDRRDGLLSTSESLNSPRRPDPSMEMKEKPFAGGMRSASSPLGLARSPDPRTTRGNNTPNYGSATPSAAGSSRGPTPKSSNAVAGTPKASRNEYQHMPSVRKYTPTFGTAGTPSSSGSSRGLPPKSSEATAGTSKAAPARGPSQRFTSTPSPMPTYSVPATPSSRGPSRSGFLKSSDATAGTPKPVHGPSQLLSSTRTPIPTLRGAATPSSRGTIPMYSDVTPGAALGGRGPLAAYQVFPGQAPYPMNEVPLGEFCDVARSDDNDE